MKKLALLISILMVFSMVACDNNNTPTPDTNTPDTDKNPTGSAGSDNTDITEGNVDLEDEDTETLTGTAQGYGGEVKVTVMVNGDDIVSVEAMGEKETQGVGSNAIEQLPDKIVEADSTDVEVVSGATVTSNAIKQAVDQALEGRK